MLSKINRKEFLAKNKVFPLRWYNKLKEEEEFYAPRTFHSCVLTSTSKSFKGRLNVLGAELTKLVQELGSDTLLFLGDNELPWLYQSNEYKPVKKAQQYLTENKIGKRFNGALQVSLLELPTFLRHLGWLTRCNAALHYFHFVDERQNILGHICQYGNIHLNGLNKDISILINSFVQASKLEFLKDNCLDGFGTNGGIKRRQS